MRVTVAASRNARMGRSSEREADERTVRCAAWQSEAVGTSQRVVIRLESVRARHLASTPKSLRNCKQMWLSVCGAVATTDLLVTSLYQLALLLRPRVPRSSL